MESVSYKKLWDHLEASKNRPTRCNKLIAVDYEGFANDVKKMDPIFMDNIVNSLFEGNFYILKSAYSKNFMENLKRNTFNYFIDKQGNIELGSPVGRIPEIKNNRGIFGSLINKLPPELRRAGRDVLNDLRRRVPLGRVTGGRVFPPFKIPPLNI